MKGFLRPTGAHGLLSVRRADGDVQDRGTSTPAQDVQGGGAALLQLLPDFLKTP